MRPAIQQTLDALEQQRQGEANRLGESADVNQRMLAVGPEAAQLLNALVRLRDAQRVVEIGGSMGYSTIWLGEAVEAVGGRLTTFEIVPAKLRQLRARVAQAGLEGTIQVLEGDARALLAEVDAPFDLVFVDAWKDDYPTYFDLAFPKLRRHGALVADNILHPAPPGPGIQAYVEKARSHPDARSQLIPLGSGLELTVKLS